MLTFFTKTFGRKTMYAGRALSANSLQNSREKRAIGICAECDKSVVFKPGVHELGLTEMCGTCGVVHTVDFDDLPTALIGFQADVHDKHLINREIEARQLDATMSRHRAA